MSARRQIIMCTPSRDSDERVFRRLGEQGYRVTHLDNSESVRQWVERNAIDLVIVDLALQSGDPLSLVRYLRERSQSSVIAISPTQNSAQSDALDRIIAIESGADDCLTRPFELRELEARIKAVMRRAADIERVKLDVLKYVSHVVKFGDCDLDIGARRLMSIDGNEIPVSAMEFALLKIFSENPNRPLHRDELAMRTHGRRWSPLDRSLDICISRLRRKIERNPSKPQIITTIRGVGYRFQSVA